MKRTTRKNLSAMLYGLCTALMLNCFSMAISKEDLHLESKTENVTMELSTKVDTPKEIVEKMTKQLGIVASISPQKPMENPITEPIVVVPSEKDTTIPEVIEIPEVTEIPEATEIPRQRSSQWQGIVLNPKIGTVEGPSGTETYYNLDMSYVIRIMRDMGYDYEYYIRDDGVKMFGDYVICAANLDLRPKGTIVETSLGMGIVCDTGSFATVNPTQLDIAVNW